MEHSTIEQLKATKAYNLFEHLKSKNVSASVAMATAIRDTTLEDDNLLPGQLYLIRKIVYYGYHPTAYLTPTEQDIYLEELASQYYFSCFRFLLSHNGFRKGAMIFIYFNGHSLKQHNGFVQHTLSDSYIQVKNAVS